MLSQKEAQAIKGYLQTGEVFSVFNIEDLNEVVEGLEEIMEIVVMTVGNHYDIRAAKVEYITVEDYTEEGDGVDVILNKYITDEQGRVEYKDEFLKNYKTLKAAQNFVNKMNYEVRYN